MISVVMPTWNGARFMDTAIASVAAQTSPAWELLIVDDGSTDDSFARAERWRDLVNRHHAAEKIRVFTSGGSNSGMAVGCNLAIREARYDIIAHLHQDDLFSPTRIESLLPFIDRYDMVFSPYEIMQHNGRVTLWNNSPRRQRSSLLSGIKDGRDLSFEAWAGRTLQRQFLSVPLGVAHRRTLFDEVGGFQPGIIAATEGLTWRRMAERGARIGFCPTVAGRYNVRSDSQARTQKPFSIPSAAIRERDPLGQNGQYLDAAWFAALARSKADKPTTGH
ncbi:MAG: glycosyltransferase family 2 protein [Deltaproteobacteria bacterium]|nr:glycosyltransferase family 2 protein [Deltaproteobacteria bacterium]